MQISENGCLTVLFPKETVAMCFERSDVNKPILLIGHVTLCIVGVVLVCPVSRANSTPHENGNKSAISKIWVSNCVIQ